MAACLSSGALVPVRQAHATLMSVDWRHHGDHLLTLDTDTHLEWLDVPVTTGLSVVDVAERLTDATDELYGFRYASAPEWNGLVHVSGGLHADIGYVDEGMRDYEAGWHLMDLLGRTGENYMGAADETQGFVGYFFGGGLDGAVTSPHDCLYHASDEPCRARRSLIYVIDDDDPHPVAYASEWWEDSAVDVSRSDIGHFLVRNAVTQVPEPSTGFLVSLGFGALLVLGGAGRAGRRQ